MKVNDIVAIGVERKQKVWQNHGQQRSKPTWLLRLGRATLALSVGSFGDGAAAIRLLLLVAADNNQVT